MKYLITCIYSLIILNTMAFSQSNRGFTINCRIDGVKDGTPFYFIHEKRNTPDADTVEKVFAKNEMFTIKGRLKQEGEFYFIKVDTSFCKLKQSQKSFIVILLDNSAITISCNLSEWPNAIINGSITHNDYLNYLHTTQMDSLNQILKDITSKHFAISKIDPNADTLRKLQELNIQAFEVIQRAKEKYLKEYPNSTFAPYLLLKLDSSAIRSFYTKMGDKAKNSYYGNKVKEQIALFDRIGAGKIAPDVKFKTADGSYLSLSKVATSGKLTLVTFWASWCKPCREEFKELRKVYKEYKNAGFNILGISVDKDANAWKKALQDEQLPWYNIIEEKRMASNMYGIYAIPETFLLDNKGRILGSSIFGKVLKDKLQAYFQSCN